MQYKFFWTVRLEDEHGVFWWVAEGRWSDDVGDAHEFGSEDVADTIANAARTANAHRYAKVRVVRGRHVQT